MTPEEISLYGEPLYKTKTCVTTSSHRRCSDCKEWKTHDHFGKNRTNPAGMENLCRGCATKRSVIRNCEKRYGVSHEQYTEMLNKQEGRCAICGSDAPGMGVGRMVVDHCHVTGNVRALLCMDCNTGIGKMKDSPKLLRKAALYLEQKT